MVNEASGLHETLPPVQRLALAYAPRISQTQTLALLALDTRLAGIVRSMTEPMLAQLRLAWWRDRLLGDPAGWPKGEPVFAALLSWPGGQDRLASLVDGWEALLGEPPLAPAAFSALADARGEGFAALAEALGEVRHRAAAQAMGGAWGLADLAPGLSDPAERQVALDALAATDWSALPLPRSLRPLAVLHGIARTATLRGRSLASPGPMALAGAVRIGLLGR